MIKRKQTFVQKEQNTLCCIFALNSLHIPLCLGVINLKKLSSLFEFDHNFNLSIYFTFLFVVLFFSTLVKKKCLVILRTNYKNFFISLFFFFLLLYKNRLKLKIYLKIIN